MMTILITSNVEFLLYVECLLLGTVHLWTGLVLLSDSELQRPLPLNQPVEVALSFDKAESWTPLCKSLKRFHYHYIFNQETCNCYQSHSQSNHHNTDATNVKCHSDETSSLI